MPSRIKRIQRNS